MKIVINKCHGGFGLSQLATQRFRDLGGHTSYGELNMRINPILIETIEELGKDASGKYSNLVIIEIPDDVEWQIEEYDGYEWVAEKHRTWK